MIAGSIGKFGFNNPVLISSDYVLIAGHGRVLAAIQLGMETIPAIILSHLSDAQQRAYRIADNAIMLKGSWSPELLEKELTFVFANEPELDSFDIGFEVAELDGYLTCAAKREMSDAVTEQVQEPDRAQRPVTMLGDVWWLGNNALACGSALDLQVYVKVLGDAKAHMTISDMPWNVPIDGHVGGLGKIKHQEFIMGSGEMTHAEFRQFIHCALENQEKFSAPGALSFQFIDWRSVADMIEIGRENYEALVNICIWVKPSGGMGSMWRSRHEMICVFRTKGGKHRNNVQLGKFGRNRTNVWEYASPSSFGTERDNLKLHPTCKNVDMIADAILDCTRRGNIVLDAFLGSGTTILAAHKVGRIGRGIELDPHYVDLAVCRIAKETGFTAKLPDGRSFAEVREARLGDGK